MIEFFDYDLYCKRLDELVNSDYKYKVIKHKPLAITPCGFPVEHYSIGNGRKHFTVMGGTHGTEIIGIDFVTKLMESIAKGIYDIKDYTLDFIPCQNPEGFIIVTESLKPYVSDNFEKTCFEYYQNFRKDDFKYLLINEIFEKSGVDHKIKDEFWDIYRFKDISKSDILGFLDGKDYLYDSDFIDDIIDRGKDLFVFGKIPSKCFRHSMFDGLRAFDIKVKDERYKILKDKVTQMMSDYPTESIIDFRANSNGVDLNKNNPINFEYKLPLKDKKLYGNMRYYNLLKEAKGPQGVPSKEWDKFEFEEENIGLLNHLEYLYKNGLYAGMISYHGTGGVIYAKPKNPETVSSSEYNYLKEIDEYNDKIAKVYSSFSEYKILDYEKNPIGTGDFIRNKYKGFLLIELSKMGGNPLGPYGDFENYKKVINDNITAFIKTLEVIENKVEE